MPQGLSDTINLIASVISIVGGAISIGGALYKWLSPSRARGRSDRANNPTYPPTVAGQMSQAHTPANRSAKARKIPHPVILWFSAGGLLAVTIYAIELLVNYTQSGYQSTGVPAGSPLVAVNAALLVVALVCVIVVAIGMAVTAYRAQAPLWLATGILALVVSLCTIGIFSIVAFAPGVFYGLYGPDEQASGSPYRR